MVLTTNHSSHPNQIWLNNGSGVFTDTGQNLGSLVRISAALGDIDSDGDPDLVMGNNGNNTVWINDGAGTFTQGTSLTGIGTTIDIAMADLDGDTDLDVFVANGSIGGQTNQVHLNNGSGVFTLLDQLNFTSNFFHSALHLSDFDNDGDVDALVGQNDNRLERRADGALALRLGFRQIKGMRAEDAVYGGEMSAHHYFRDFAYCDSGMIPWLLVTALIGAAGQPLSSLVAQRMAAYPCSGEINRTIDDPAAVLSKVEDTYREQAETIEHVDGLSMVLGQWRFNLRMSNTEPVVRLNVESRGDAALMQARTEELLALIDAG